MINFYFFLVLFFHNVTVSHSGFCSPFSYVPARGLLMQISLIAAVCSCIFTCRTLWKKPSPVWRTPPAGRWSSGGGGPSSWPGGWCLLCAAAATELWACRCWQEEEEETDICEGQNLHSSETHMAVPSWLSNTFDMFAVGETHTSGLMFQK